MSKSDKKYKSKSKHNTLTSALERVVRPPSPLSRFEQVLSFGWKYMLPLALFNLVATAALTLSGGLHEQTRD